MAASILKILMFALPWQLRRPILQAVFGYELHPSSRIGFSWVYPKRLRMSERARIGHCTFSKGLDLIDMGRYATIGNLNWITAYPSVGGVHFQHAPSRVPSLILEDQAAITSQHFLDCASQIRIGAFSTVAGLRSQFFTHSIDIQNGRQDTQPIDIGAFCLIATGTVVLPGASVPDYSVVSACSVVNRELTQSYRMYGGTPARPVKELPTDCAYFTRSVGFVK
jgi:acetyltransferase-like isoleucine patch superfamily enzyme